MKLEQVIYPFNPALEQSVYPYNTNFKELPFYLAGIGGSEYQGHITRPEGFMWHQIFFCGGGSGTLKYDDKSIIISQGDYFLFPKDTLTNIIPIPKSGTYGGLPLTVPAVESCWSSSICGSRLWLQPERTLRLRIFLIE